MVSGMVREYWTGGEWQVHCCKLLSIKYGEDVQLVPDRVHGDQGMEAYRLDDGMVYQCYAVEDPLSLADQTEAQKKKIRTDVAKLVDKQEDVMKVLGSEYRIRRWVLLTPEFDDKELVKYARMKSQKIRCLDPRPPWCHDDFQIVVHKDTDMFAAQLPLLYGTNSSISINIPFPESSDLERVDILESDKLREKLSEHPKLADSPEKVEELRKLLLLEYLHGKSQLDKIQGRYSATFDKIKLRADLTLRGLPRQLALKSEIDEGVLVDELIRSLQSDLPELAAINCEQLARYFVSSWWIECPMRYGYVS